MVALAPAGGWAEGLITINQPREQLERIVDAFRQGGGEGKPRYLQVHVSYAASDGEARANAHDQWRSNAITAAMAETLRLPEEFDAAASKVRPDDMDEHVRISSSASAHAEWLEEYLALGFEEIYVHNVGRNQAQFIDFYGTAVLPVVGRGDIETASGGA